MVLGTDTDILGELAQAWAQVLARKFGCDLFVFLMVVSEKEENNEMKWNMSGSPSDSGVLGRTRTRVLLVFSLDYDTDGPGSPHPRGVPRKPKVPPNNPNPKGGEGANETQKHTKRRHDPQPPARPPPPQPDQRRWPKDTGTNHGKRTSGGYRRGPHYWPTSICYIYIYLYIYIFIYIYISVSDDL